MPQPSAEFTGQLHILPHSLPTSGACPVPHADSVSGFLQPVTHEAAPNPSGKLLVAKEVAEKLRVPLSWVRKHGHGLPGLVRLGKYVRWLETAIDAFLYQGGQRS